MASSIIFSSPFKSIVQQDSSDIFYLITQEKNCKNYRVMPKGFRISFEPNSKIRFFFGKEEIFL